MGPIWIAPQKDSATLAARLARLEPSLHREGLEVRRGLLDCFVDGAGHTEHGMVARRVRAGAPASDHLCRRTGWKSRTIACVRFLEARIAARAEANSARQRKRNSRMDTALHAGWLHGGDCLSRLPAAPVHWLGARQRGVGRAGLRRGLRQRARI